MAKPTRPPAQHRNGVTSRSFAWIYGVLIAVVLLAPLPFASVPSWSWAPLAAITAVALAAWAIGLGSGSFDFSIAPRKVLVPALLLAGVLVWIVVQVAPFTPASWHHPLWRDAAEVLKTDIPGRITLDPYRTVSALTRLLWYLAIFWLALQLCADRRLARRGIQALALAAVAYACYGLAVEFSGANMVLWIDKTAYRDSLTSTFINKNSYAAYAGIGLICLSAVVAARLIESSKVAVPPGRRLAELLNVLVARSWYLLLAWGVVFTALVLANSRAGLLSSLIGLIAFLGSLAIARSVPSRVPLGFAAAAGVAAALFFFVSGELVGQRYAETGRHAKARLALYELTVEAIADRPILGTGFGTYDKVFELYRRDVPEMHARAAQAHNTYLENALELGVPAAIALNLSLAWLVGLCVLGLRRRRRDAIYPAVGVGVSVLLGFHATVDFSVQIPAVAASYAFILGLACAQSWRSVGARGPN